jgi:hypothetical protein
MLVFHQVRNGREMRISHQSDGDPGFVAIFFDDCFSSKSAYADLRPASSAQIPRRRCEFQFRA